MAVNKITTIVDAKFRGDPAFKRASSEVRAFRKETKMAQQAAGGFRGSMAQMVKTVGIFAAAMAALRIGKKIIMIASDAEETQSKFNVVFRGMEKTVNDWAEQFAEDVGRANQDIKAFSAGIADVLKPMGLQTAAAADMSQKMVALALDVASFNNRQDADVIRAFTTALTGERESLKTLGIVIGEADVQQEAYRAGLVEVGEELDKTAKATATMNLLFANTADAQGDLMRTNESFANQLKRMQAETKNLAEEIGNKLLPAMTGIVAATTEVITNMKLFVKESDGATAQIFRDMGDLASTITSTVGEALKGVIGLMKAFRLEAALLEPLGDIFRSVAAGIKTIKTGIQATGDVIGGLLGEFRIDDDLVGTSALAGIAEARNRIIGLSDELFAATKEGRALTASIGSVNEETKKMRDEATDKADTFGGGGGGGGADKAAKEAEAIVKAQEKIRDSLRKTQTGFSELRLSGIDSLTDLQSAHEKTIDQMREKSEELRESLLELTQSFEQQAASLDQSVAGRAVEQEELIRKLKEELGEALGGGTRGDPERAQELEQQLAEEEKALRAFVATSEGLEEELAEARRRAALTSFERFLEDNAARREESQKEFEEKREQIESELKELEEQRVKEQEIFEAKREAIEKINEQIRDNWSDILGDMEKRTEEFAELAQAKFEAIKTAFEAITSLTSGGGEAADLRSAGEFLPEGTAQLFGAPAAGGNNININLDLGGVKVESKEDVDSLIERLQEELARAAELINKNAAPTPNL